MKKLFFFFAMLLSVAVSAQSGVTVTPVSAKSNTVTFNVSWLNSSRTGTHNSKVWVFVDYRAIVDNVPLGSWMRAPVSGTPIATVGTPSRETGNDKGFWLQGTSGSSGTYNATVTVTLSNVPAQFNWCAYVSDYPPNVTANNGTYTLRGTPPFILAAANGTTSQTVTGTTLATSALTITPTTIRDKTDCPGIFCPYQGSDLYIDATHLCQQRTSGAKNWEAYIKDSRDSKYYRIVLMSDSKWWLAQNVKLASYNGSTIGSAMSGCTEDECGRSYPWAQVYASYAGGSSSSTGNVQGICPPGWLLPVTDDFDNMTKTMGSDATICQYLRSKTSSCSPRLDYYGFANERSVSNGQLTTSAEGWYANDKNREDGLQIDLREDGLAYTCDQIYKHGRAAQQNAAVRCFRQL
ncbi:MAG: hypothetical protein LBU42_02950 [Prevotellaceae bacterium]|jgi:uncharacterized protein (TIGR02145 family)|nr:hypothetical protein [Prevotellaceae bacterium]